MSRQWRRDKAEMSPEELRFRKLLRQADGIARFPAKMSTDVALDSLLFILDKRQPVRIQRKRTKGWRMPRNTIYVGRNGSKDHSNPLANPYRIGDWAYLGYDVGIVKLETREQVILAFRINIVPKILNEIEATRGKNQACWCPLDKPCHADVLLELANKEVS